jgi:DNA-binding MarR family transcriptional regulator
MKAQAGNIDMVPEEPDRYLLEEQVGFILRRASQRHKAIFSDLISGDLTVTQFAALAKLYELKACSQNLLGRHTALDAATIKGVIDRLTDRGLTRTWPDPTDARRFMVGLTTEGEAVIEQAIAKALRITEQTLAPLEAEERVAFLRLLEKIC